MNHSPLRNALISLLLVVVVFVTTERLSEEVSKYTSFHRANLAQVSSPLASGLVARYTFDGGDAQDSAGNNHGTLNGATANTSGKYNGGITFDGVDDYVQVPSSSALNITGNQVTLMLWVNPSSGYSNQRGGVLKGPQTNGERYFLGVNYDNYEPDFRIYAGGTQTRINTGHAGTVPANTWTHIAGTYDGNTMRIYVNGAEVGSIAKSGNIDSSSDLLLIGRRTLTDARFFAGSIDEVRIYNRALTQLEIQGEMGEQPSGTSPSSPSPSPSPSPSSSVTTQTPTVSLSSSPSPITSGQSSTL